MHIGAAAFIAAIGFVLVQASGCLGESSPVASSACTPGEAVACVGLGGCSGGQRCNAQGNGYDDCQCAVDNDGGDGETSDAADDHPKDSGAADAAQLPPTSAGLHLTFAITRSNDTPTT